MMELLLFLTLVLVAGAAVTAPLRRPHGARMRGGRSGGLEAARDAKLREISDAELDHLTGKLSDEDYAAVDGALRAEAAGLLRELDSARAAER
jgi:hypothetical protein